VLLAKTITARANRIFFIGVSPFLG